MQDLSEVAAGKVCAANRAREESIARQQQLRVGHMQANATFRMPGCMQYLGRLAGNG